MKLKKIKESYINVSGNIYDSDYINLAQIENGKINFGNRTLFLSEDEKKFLNSQKIEKKENVVYIFKYGDSYGLVANLDIDEYRKDKIKCHELVLPDVVQGMGANYHIYNAETAPVCITHNEEVNLKGFTDENLCDEKYEFDEITVYIYFGEKADNALDLYSDIETLYVADGHHRLYTTEILRNRNDVLCCFYGFNQIDILPIHRVLKNVDECTINKAKSFIYEFMEVSNTDSLDNGYVRITTPDESFVVKFKDVEMDTFWNNDVYRLNTQIIITAFRIFDTSKIGYIYQNDIEERIKNIKNGEVVLELSGLSKEDFLELSTKSCILPPKTTYFTPKFPSFLIFKKYK